MAISYPVTPSLAVRQRILAFGLRLRRAVAVTQSPFSGVQQVQAWPAALWEADLTFASSGPAAGAPVEAFVTSLRGQYGTFLLGPSYRIAPRGTANTSGVTVNGSGQTGNSLAVTGLGAGRTLLAGDFLQLGSAGSARLYMVVEDATANGSGQATLSIEPPLRTSPSSGAAVTLSSPVGQWRLATNAVTFQAGIAAAYEQTTLSCIEAL